MSSFPPPRPKFYRSESEMSPGPQQGGISPPVMIPGSAPPFHTQFHHQHQFGAAKIRDRSPRLSAEMRKNRDGTSPTGPPSNSSTSSIHRGSVTGIGSIGLPVLGGRGRGVMSDSHMQRTFHEAMRQRRTSLPANSLSLGGKSLISGSTLSEAKGLIADMLMNKDLPGNVASCLRAVASLLEQRNIPMNGLINDFGLPSVVENPYGGESMVVGASKPRISNITFSTVTSATGLPTVPAEPNKARSSSYWKTDPSPSSTNHNEHPTSVDLLRKLSVSRKESGTHVDTVVTTVDGQRYDTKELDSDAEFQNLGEWAFPIFRMATRYPKTCLSRLTYNVFQQAELFRIFKVSPLKFFNFFHALEKGYWEIPYHNRIHAADVLHGSFYLSANPIRPAFGAAKSPDSGVPQPPPSAFTIMSQLSSLELMALYTAAAMHDFDHPGRTNAYLVTVEDKKAILYNDRSVLENHHAAESWKLLCKTENFFIENLDPAEMKRFRYLVLEYILATDLKLHFDAIYAFNDRLPEMDLQLESDRLLVAKMIIKMADINSPTKPNALHRQWTDRICEEFYEQGDEEKRRGLDVTPYMDRNEPNVAKLQDSFIRHVVSPLAIAMHENGLLPVMPGLEHSELIINLNHNHKKWMDELEELEGEVVETNGCNGSLANGIIEEETASTSDSPDPRHDSPESGGSECSQ